MAKSRHYYIRRTHRYMGVILGIQFLLWTIGGLYFSWSDIDEIHGDFQHRHPPHLAGNFHFVSPDTVLHALSQRVDSLHSIQMVNILGKPFYSISYFSGKKFQKILADAQTGAIRNAISKTEAEEIAKESFNGAPVIKSTEYLAAAGSHHEYREKPLPAWAVTFDHPTSTTVYVSAEYGRVESFRNNKWRIFDFLWMMHTMDYKGRDDMNNILLRAFSIFGLLTIVSGFVLFAVSSKFRKRF